MRGLAKVVDLRDRGCLFRRVFNRIEIDLAFIGEIVEDIQCLGGLGSGLLVSKDEIDPLVQVLRDIVAFQRHAHLACELARVAMGPRREHHTIHKRAFLLHTEIKAVGILEKVAQIVELGNELLDVGHCGFRRRAPGLLDAVEEAIGVIEFAALQRQKVLRKRLQADQIVEHNARRRIVRAVVERRNLALRVFPGIVAHLKFIRALRGQRTHRLGQIAVHGRVLEIELGRRIVREHPWEDRILGEIVVRPSCQAVDVDQVLEVGNLAHKPALCECLERNFELAAHFLLNARDGTSDIGASAGHGLMQSQCVRDKIDQLPDRIHHICNGVQDLGRHIDRHDTVVHLGHFLVLEDQQVVEPRPQEDLESDFLQQVAALVDLLDFLERPLEALAALLGDDDAVRRCA
eukprot:comp20268_c0_seq1/m.40279 comp20268_c0_seq1/g.40279  ORF comp20268_c0_seq1/g.40279 comp20268_c0_seq1/m.40279 type:complete len:404 (-) comp20268_c0_seq1:503-1714(-)